MTPRSPPVAYGGGGVDSIVTPEVGVLVPRDPASLGQAVRELLTDEPRRLGMVGRARRRVEDRFEAARLAARLEQWLNGLTTAS